ncbi:MAG: carboxypeptidase-like regulatory domain-containing protein [Deltaproteobacteria bacterium]|nr:carboxypeptidase-like regulatory domain-containing protein [Deltaproteobacteria bacterium]
MGTRQRVLANLVAFVVFTSVLEAGEVAAARAAEVTLPLSEFIALSDRAEAQDQELGEEVDPGAIEWVSQETHISLDGELATIRSRFEVTVLGIPENLLPVPLTGLAGGIQVEPSVGLALHRDDQGTLVLVPSEAGSYFLELQGAVPLERRNGRLGLDLQASSSPVAITNVDLPLELAWECDGAVVVLEEEKGQRRHLRLAFDRSQSHRLEVWRQVEEESSEEALVRIVAATYVDLGAQGARRLDLLHYEVLRGNLATFRLELPQGFEPERLVTDEGKALPEVSGRQLEVHRKQKLEGVGFLAVTSRPVNTASLSLPSLRPVELVRARYLLFSSSIAARAEPTPVQDWARVDLEDLPLPLRTRFSFLQPAAAWRWSEVTSEGGGMAVEATLGLDLLPAAPSSEAVIRDRQTTTLLTVDGSLVHRDQFWVRGAGGALELELPSGATFWSASVGGQPVRPMILHGTLTLALPMAPGAESRVEVVSVEERAVPSGRTQLAISLAQTNLPVLGHQWRLLLPQDARYRLASSELSPVDPSEVLVDRLMESLEVRSAKGRKVSAPTSGGRAEVRGQARAEDGTSLPGVTVGLSSETLTRSLSTVTDEDGQFWFRRLQGGAYTLTASLDGFSSARQEFRLDNGQVFGAVLRMSLATISEEVLVTAETYSVPTARSFRDQLAIARDSLAREAFQKERNRLRQGTVGGVRPLPVEIPETGKVLVLSAALPPSGISATLQVRPARRSARGR